MTVEISGGFTAANFFASLTLMLCFSGSSFAGLLSEPAVPDDSPATVPSFPLQPDGKVCRLDLSNELFGGVGAACGRDLDRSRCCPVLAAWLFAAHARMSLEVPAKTPPYAAASDQPMLPDDSQKCVNSLQSSLEARNIRIPQPNASCDAVLCFCGIRLHLITSLSCPAAFNLTGARNATPTAAVRNLEKNCRNSSYAGCTRCLGALQKISGGAKNGTHKGRNDEDGGGRAAKMFRRDCQLMGLTWLLARNKTAYIPTVSAVLRAVMYSSHPPQDFKCSPDQENMPLAVNSVQLDRGESSSSLGAPPLQSLFPVLPLLLLVNQRNRWALNGVR